MVCDKFDVWFYDRCVGIPREKEINNDDAWLFAVLVKSEIQHQKSTQIQTYNYLDITNGYLKFCNFATFWVSKNNTS